MAPQRGHSACRSERCLEFLGRSVPPPLSGGLDLNSSNSGCARLRSGVAPPLGVVEKEAAVLIVLVRRHRRAVGAAVRRAVDDEVPGAVEEETGPAAVRRPCAPRPSGCATCTCPWCAWHRRCSTRCWSAPTRTRTNTIPYGTEASAAG